MQPEAPGGTSRQRDEHFFLSSHDFCASDILSSQCQNRLRFLTGSISPSHLHHSHYDSPVPQRPSPHFFLQLHAHQRRVETVKPSLPHSSALPAAAQPMIRHLILLLGRGQRRPAHVSRQSPPVPLGFFARAGLKIAHPWPCTARAHTGGCSVSTFISPSHPKYKSQSRAALVDRTVWGRDTPRGHLCAGSGDSP